MRPAQPPDIREALPVHFVAVHAAQQAVAAQPRQVGVERARCGVEPVGAVI
jgi:hypothetical protein